MSVIPRMKKCKDCKEVKNLDTEFYKAGGSFQARCRHCHNVKRYDYKITPPVYVKKPTGFDKLKDDVKNSIIYDVYIRTSYKEIAQKNNIPYGTLLNWKRKGTIPEYIPPVN